jgi:tape measure domain-containing protein
MADGIRIKIGIDGVPQVQAGANAAAAALDKTARSADGLAGSFGGVGSAAGALRNLGSLTVVAATAREFVQAADAVTVLRNQLQLATGNAASATVAYDSLFAIAQRSRVSFTELGSTFASISRATDGMGISQARLLTVTESIGNAMAISGGSAESMKAALVQLSQGFASGTLRGEELNSVMEQTPRLARAIADGLGVSIGKLREMGKAGELTADAVLKALESQSAVLAGEAQTSVVTVGQAMTQLANSATRAVGELNQTTGATSALATGLQSLGGVIDNVADRFARARADGHGFIGSIAAAQIMAAAEAFGHVDERAANVGKRLNDAEKELAALQLRFGAQGGIYLAMEVEKASQLVAELKRAKQAQDDLKAERSTSQSQQFSEASGTIGAIAAKGLEEQRQAQEALAGIRNRALGVDKSYTDQIQKLHGFLQAGRLTQAEYTEAVQKLTAATFKQTGAAKAARDAQRELEREREKQQSVLNAVAGVNDDYVESLRRLESMRRLGILAEADYIAQVELLIARQPSAIKLAKDAADAAKLEATAREGASRIAQRAIEADISRNESLQGTVSGLRDQLDALTQTEYALDMQAAATMRAHAADLEWQAGNEGGNLLLEQRARLLRQNADLTEQLANKKVEKAGEQARRDYERETIESNQRIADEAGQALADALMEGGRSAGDYLEDYFRTLVLQPIVKAIVQPIAAAAQGAVGSVLSSATGGSNLLQGASAANSIYGLYQGGGVAGATAAAANYGAVYSGAAYGTGFGTQQSTMLAAQEAGMVSQAGGSTLGTAAGILGWVAFAYAAAQYGKKLYSEGFTGSQQLDGNKWYQHTFENFKTEALKDLGISDKWAEILGGSVRLNHMFGRAEPRIQGTGVLGTFSGGAFSGERYADVLEKGGLFKDDKRYTIAAELDSQIDRFFDDAAAAVVDNAKKYGDALGLPASLMAGITQDVKVQLTGDIEKDKEAIAKALGEYGDALLAGFGEQVKPIAVYGETVAQTIERVGGALLTVNDAVEQLGGTALAKSVTGGAAAADLTARFGGSDQFASATSSFYAAFYSEAEQVEALTQRLSGTFADLGLTMPNVADGADAAKDAYRELLKSQDLNTEAGRAAFTSLIALSGAFDSLAQAAEKAAAEERDRLARISEQTFDLDVELLRAQDNVQAAVNLQRERELQRLAELEVSLKVAAGTFTNAQRAINAAADATEAAAKAAERAAEAEAKRRSVLSGADSVAADFLPAADLQQYLATRVQDILGGAGFGEIPLTNIFSATRDDVLQLWQAVGVDGKQALLDALPLWEQLQTSIHGTSNAIRDYRAGTLAEAIDEARLAGMTPEQRKAAREARSAQLFNDIATSDDPVAAAEKLRQLTMAGLQDEIQLREEANRKAIEGLDKQIDAAKRLQDLGANIGQFLGTLRFGDLSPLNARQQVGSARSLYERTLRDAQAGDVVAQGNLLGNAQAYLQEAQGTFGSGAGYVAVYEQVTRDLDAFGDKITAQRPELALLEAQRDSLASVATNTGDMLAALLRIDDALADRLDGGVGGSTLASAVRVEAANAPSFVEGNPGSPGGLSGGRDITGLVSGPDVVQTAFVAFNTEQAVQSGLLRQTNQKLDAVHERLGAILQVGRAGHPDTVAILTEAVSVLEDIRGRQARGQAPDTSSRKAA